MSYIKDNVSKNFTGSTYLDFDSRTEARLNELAMNTGDILITGGSGYLGTVITEMLVHRGFRVTVLDNLNYSQNTLFNLMHRENFNFIYGDVTNKSFMEEILKKNSFDYIIPLAAIVGFPISEQKPELTWLVNHTSIVDMLHIIGKETRLIFPSTNSGYGLTTGQVECDENTEIAPVSTYGKSKVEAEKEIMRHGNSVSMRFATLFGFSQRMRTDLMVNDFVLKAVRDKSIVLFEKKFKRNFLHVRDAARCFLWSMLNWEKMRNEVYNVGHPDYNLNKEELCQLIKEKVPDFQVFYGQVGSDPDKRNYIISNKKILSTGFDFRYPLDRGIEELVRGYNAFRDYRFRNY